MFFTLSVLIMTSACGGGGGSDGGSATPTPQPGGDGGSSAAVTVTVTQISNASPIDQLVKALKVDIKNGSATEVTLILPSNITQAKIFFSPSDSVDVDLNTLKASFNGASSFEIHLANSVGENVEVGVKSAVVGSEIQVDKRFSIIFDDPNDVPSGQITIPVKLSSSDIAVNTTGPVQIPYGDFATDMFLDEIQVQLAKLDAQGNVVQNLEAIEITLESSQFTKILEEGRYSIHLQAKREMTGNNVNFTSDVHVFDLQENGHVTQVLRLKPIGVTPEIIRPMTELVEKLEYGDLMDVNLYNIYGTGSLTIAMPAEQINTQLGATSTFNIELFTLASEYMLRTQFNVNKAMRVQFLDGENLIFDTDENDNSEYDLPIILNPGNSLLKMQVSNIGAVGLAEYEAFFYGATLNTSTSNGPVKINISE